MTLQGFYQSGAEAALEKLAVSGAMYGRALANRAAQTGRALPRAQMAPLRAASRAQFEPDLSAMARSRGAMMPTPEQLALRKFTGALETRSGPGQSPERMMLKNRAIFELGGHQYQGGPDLEQRLSQVPRRAKDTSSTAVAPTQVAPAATAAGKRVAKPETVMGRWPSPVRTGPARSRSFEAIESTTASPVRTNPWAGQEATMPEHFSSIPGMPAYRPY